jgi:hypothetical protein
MFDLCNLYDAILQNSLVLATNAFSGPVLWNMLLLFSIIGAIIAIIVLFGYSKKPDDWKHESKIEGYYSPGKLRNLAESIKVSPIDYGDDAPMRKLVQTVFFDKVRSNCGLSGEEILKLKEKDKNKLREVIKDDEIVDWIYNIKKKKGKKDKMDKKEKYLMDVNQILDKMEAWGK